MKRVKNSDIKFKINKKLVYLPNFVIRFYTVNQKEYFFEKTQDDLVSYEREATVDDVEVILSGGTTVTEYYLPLNWSQLMFVGQGILNYKLTNNIEDPEFPDYQYNKEEVVTTDFYIDSIKVDPEPEESLIERVIQLEEHLDEEIVNREEADAAISGAVDSEIARAVSAETALDVKIDDEIERATSAETAIDAKIDAETNRATSAETALQTAINDEATARANADTALQTAITNEESRAREAESAITNALNAEVTRATAAEAALDAKIDAVSGNVISETTRATTAENALSGAIDSISAATSGSVEELDAKIDTVSGNVITEEARAKGVENALSGAIDTLDVRFFDDAKYEDSGNTKVINFYNGNVVKATIDCTDFLVDGMIDNVYIENGYLVIDFNTASGKQDIRIPLTDIFNPANYYTKDETSGATEIANALAEKLAISDFNTYSGAVDTLINSKASQSTVDALNGVVTAHTADTSIHVTSNDKEKWNKVDDKADTTALTAVNDALTAHTADTSIHLTTGDVQSQIDSSISGKENHLNNYLKTWELKRNYDSGRSALYFTYRQNDSELSGWFPFANINNTSVATGTNFSLVETSAIVTSITSGSTDSEIPSAKAVYDALGSASGGITSGEVQTMITSATTPIYQTIQDNEEVTAEALNVLNAALSGKADSSDVYTTGQTSGATQISNALAEKLDVTAYTPTDLSNYYTKDETSGKTEISSALAGKASKNQVDGLANAVGGHINNTSIHVTASDKTKWNKVDDKADTTAVTAAIDAAVSGKANSSDVYLKSETSGATELATAFAATQPKLSAGTGIDIDITSNVISVTGGTGGGISSAECQTMIDNSISGKANSSDVYLKSETSGATELATAFAAKSDFSGSYNDLTDKPTIPTSASQLTNDSGYITSSALNGYATEDYVTAATNDMATKTWVGQQGYLTEHQDISGKQDVSGMTAYTQNSVFAAYTAATNSALASKQDTLTAGTGISIVNDVISVTATSPTVDAYTKAESDGKFATITNFNSHSGDTTAHITSAERTVWNAKSDFSGSYNDLTDKPTIPTVPTSNTAFTNDAGYITANDITGKTDVTAFTAHTADTTAHVTSAEKATWNNKSDFSGSYNDLTNKLSAGTNITIVDNVISATGGGGSITSGEVQTMIDNSISGKTNQSDFTAYTAATNTALANKVETSAVTSAVTSGSTDVLTSGGVYEQLGGLKIVKMTESQYSAATKDANTLYVVVPDPTGDTWTQYSAGSSIDADIRGIRISENTTIPGESNISVDLANSYTMMVASLCSYRDEETDECYTYENVYQIFDTESMIEDGPIVYTDGYWTYTTNVTHITATLPFDIEVILNN